MTEKQYRQGDVLLRRVEALPANVRPKQSDEERIVLAYGEVTGHAHAIDATLEPDGSSKFYFLRVPPTMRTAREAVAWTFGLSECEY